MEERYVLKVSLHDNVWKNFEDNVEPYFQLKGLSNFYNELLEDNKSVVILNTGYIYDFKSYEYDYDTIRKAYDIITSYESKQKDKSTLMIKEY